MSSEQTEAIVLRVIEFSETSLIVTLYTRHFGRLSALAKGARRPKNPFEGALDLLAFSRIVVICKSSDALDLLTEAKLQRRFRAGQTSLIRLHCGYYVAELLRMWTENGVASEALFELTKRTIEAIDGDGDALSAVLDFELRGMRLLGNAPATDACVGCGGAIESATARLPFAYQLGGVLCPTCRGRQRDVASVRRGVVDQIAVRQLSDRPAAGPLVASDYRDLRAVVSRYVCTTLGVAPRTQSLLPANWVAH